MKRFRRELDARQTRPDGRRWKARRRPNHRQKLALVLSNLRPFAMEQAERGVAVYPVAVTHRAAAISSQWLLSWDRIR